MTAVIVASNSPESSKVRQDPLDRCSMQKLNPFSSMQVKIVSVAIYCPFGKFRRAKLYCQSYCMVLKANDRRTSSPLPR
ncbi:hypothetical protein TNCV_3811311 [Trichonephila clavipes]|nr:hypothetical protein TNCV_3811311 [Trichonephila clavipes]